MKGAHSLLVGCRLQPAAWEGSVVEKGTGQRMVRDRCVVLAPTHDPREDEVNGQIAKFALD